jgi:hypothetical protein
MKIESIIKRDPPTEVVLGDTAYQFKPDSQGRHVCDVTDKAHIARLLSIVEGFQIPDDEDAPKDLTPIAPVQAVTPPVLATLQPIDDNALRGSDVHPATLNLADGSTVELADVVEQAYELSGLTTADWNALAPEVRHNLIDVVLDALDVPNEGTPADAVAALVAAAEPSAADTEAAAKAERDELAAAWKARTGSLPHYKWTAAKIREELAKPEGQ